MLSRINIQFAHTAECAVFYLCLSFCCACRSDLFRGSLDLDALLISTTTVGILETKSTLRVDDVLKVHNALIPRFHKSFRDQQHKDLAVIVAGELILPNAADLARELGYILLKPGKQGIIADASCYRAA